MASRAPSARWLWRDLRLSLVVLVVGAFSIGAILYFSGWMPSQRHLAGLLFKPDGGPQVNHDELYTGSVILVPARGEQCWQLLFDNRTGTMRENGHINCYEVVSQLEEEKNAVTPSKRINVISNAFRGE
jgi:hypothetical protein